MFEIDKETFAAMAPDRQSDIVERVSRQHYELGQLLAMMHVVQATQMLRADYPGAHTALIGVGVDRDGVEVRIYEVLDRSGAELYHYLYSSPNEDDAVVPVQEQLDLAAGLGYDFGDTRKLIELPLTVR